MNENTLKNVKNLKLICVAATGYDNIDVGYCRSRGIAVCNVIGYSTDSVAQVTLAMALSLYTHLQEYREDIASGRYLAAGVPNCLVPQYHELAGKTWGVVGYGHIGRKVASVAGALGCHVIACRRTPSSDVECVDIDTLCRQADIISIHTPLNEGTANLISRERITLMKKEAIVLNLARGRVTDEAALAEAVEKGRIGGLGVDVYSTEPFPPEHPFNRIKDFPNVCLTPHMAWGAYEARVRCLEEMAENIRSFLQGGHRNRVD